MTYLMSAFVNASELTIEEINARETGIRLFNQFKAISATPFLETAAQAGDAEAQYYLGEALRKNNRSMTHESQRWLEAAANQGHIYAMIRLGRSSSDLCSIMSNCPQGKRSPAEWLEHARRTTLSLANNGDAEAMFLMYEITSNADWLSKAAEAGYALAQYWKAVSIYEGTGFYLFGNRKKDAARWFKASAEGGYPKSMRYYIAILADKGDWEGIRHWHYEMAKTGFADGVFELGLHLIHQPKRYDYKLDLVRGYGLLSLLLELDGGGDLKSYAEEILSRLSSKMTPEQIEQAQEFAEKWKATHPPVSYFPDKLSIY